ncbi:nacht domain containing protein [Grosmannia clavigera kw1407]|uniref:Nacht domain containing protein n=1 Tax=Grosmannia clavigera (strain kw1407 / UAMH 11150) TaxID=655863 RepID=F0X9C9_GROCL|nr:nacht domain containing protein [Grosmannia clavigera kw1407]EFX05618.1 nacht domain containing protein [Grosmannia clavigera kw1407]
MSSYFEGLKAKIQDGMLIKQEHIAYLCKNRFLDDKLPFSVADATKMLIPEGQRFAESLQWEFCPYVFPKNKHNYQLDQQRILPFIHCQKVGEGASGEVEKVVIAASHYEFSSENDGELEVVRKRFRVRGSKDVSEREYKCLRLLDKLGHPNIIPLFGSYTYDENRYLLLKAFDRDLEDFLEDDTRHKDFQQDLTFYSALTGLASALSKTHNFMLTNDEHKVDFEAIGYHHDLKPRNIMVSHDSFILADFGEGNIKSAQESSHTRYKEIVGSYIAPECTDEEENPQTINRAVDVWALGCIIAEVVTYMEKGTRGVRQFRKQRRLPGRLHRFEDDGFYSSDGEVKEAVLEWLKTLRSNANADLVELINLSLKALSRIPSDRPLMHELHQSLADLSLRKYLSTTEELLVNVCRDGASHGTDSILKDFRRACDLLKQWEELFSSNINIFYEDPKNLPEEAIRILKNLLQVLEEEKKESRLSDNENFQRADLACSALGRVYELWELLAKLPEAQGILSQRREADGNLPKVSLTTPVNILLPDFKKAARKFRDGLPASVSLDEIDKVASIDAVYDIVEKIQEKQQERNGLRNLARIQPYLHRLEGFADTIQKHVIGESPGIPALLWGPIALLLQLAVSSNVAFDSIVEATAMVGEVLPDYPALDAIFQESMEAKEILLLYFQDIMMFYAEAFQPFKNIGKSFLSGEILQRFYGATKTATAFSFLSYQVAKDAESHDSAKLERVALTTIHSLIIQMAKESEDLMEIVCGSNMTQINSDIAAAGDLLASIVRHAGSTLLIIDGLDEISEAQRGSLVVELLRLASSCNRLKLVVSSRPEADLTRHLHNVATTVKVHENNKESISNYVKTRAERIIKSYSYYPGEEEQIRDLFPVVAERAKGMFLYAQLIMDMVSNMETLPEIRDELTVPPEDLDAT